ncbi:hypothetical protein GFS24_19700 [Chitinophaga sp. SYP-B3965]|uniref:hypothetical protein n=1 Tax=Chitinophaga sp. SYP-B3965 TaxID=2663120 RepID=UPI0012996AEE|nr:hypothetical protein [Chitinophaga sp. SYP-B3965]MRG47354.1 hypothetical protein [Chitinophaga sp. SYP-B3965]
MKCSIFSFLLLLLASFGKAQDVKLASGKIEGLKGVDSFHIVFDYTKLSVGDAGREANYIRLKRAEAEKRAPGSAYAWEEKWRNDKGKHYEPKFIEQFLKASDIKVGDFPDTRYQLIFKPMLLEPGYSNGVINKAAKLDAEVWIVEKDNPKKALVKIKVENAAAKGKYDEDPALRIAEAYGDAARGLSRFLGTGLKK